MHSLKTENVLLSDAYFPYSKCKNKERKRNMNASGMIRGYMSKGYGAEDFLNHVSTTIQRQLQEWDENYEVKVEKRQNAHFLITVYLDTPIHKVGMTKDEVQTAQEKSPFALDRHIWGELQNQGMLILYSSGNYLSYVL